MLSKSKKNSKEVFYVRGKAISFVKNRYTCKILSSLFVLNAMLFCSFALQAQETKNPAKAAEQEQVQILTQTQETLLPSTFDMPDRAPQRVEFLRLEKQVWKMDNKELDTALNSLGDYPLVPYLVYQHLTHRLRLSDEKRVRSFLTSFESTPLAKKLRRKWLDYLAKYKKRALFIEFYKPTNNAELACTFLDYQIQQGVDQKDLFDEIAKLWTVGRSQPKQCDGIFKIWIDAGELSEDLILLRVSKAANGGKHTLIPYLRSLLPSNKQYLASLWHSVRRDPSYLRNVNKFTGQYSLIEAEIMTYGLSRLIWRNPKLAISVLQKAEKNVIFTEAQKAKIYGKFGIKLAIDNHEDAEHYLTKAAQFGQDQEVRRWHLAYLLRQQDWARLVLFLETAQPQTVSGNEYPYWLARAYEQLGRDDEAQTLYAQLANERHYYGFLASARTQQAYSLQDHPLNVLPQDIKLVISLDSSHRAYELRELNRLHEARLEWRVTQDLVNEQQKLASGVVADAWGWHDQAIFTFAREGYLDDVKKRFPMAYQNIIVREANKNKIEPEWAFAIARRESSFMSDAVSSANARGLMQVLPSTAKYLEKKRITSRQLLDAELNAKLGNKYLRYLLNKVDDNTVLATASYNAGWRRVRDWLPEQDQDADIWVELIPYRETRNYVKAVLAYKQIYKSQTKSSDENVFKEFISSNIPPRI